MSKSLNFLSIRTKFLSIRSKLMLLLLAVSFISSLVVVLIATWTGEDIIENGIKDHLTSVRATKQYQIESYFEALQAVVKTFGESRKMANALRDFKSGFRELKKEKISIECGEKLSEHYNFVLDSLKKNMEVKANPDLYIPDNAEACYLQYEYIVDNVNPIGKKHLLTDAGDGSKYSKIHKKYHQYLTGIVRDFGFYDVFLIDLDYGDVLYTYHKETDFATNLYYGPYTESNLEHLVQFLKKNSDKETPSIVDFEAYRPSFNAPAAFIGIAITDGPETIGALVFQLPVDEINRIMTGGRDWEKDGLGDTGETYLVGADDYLMRSISRFYLEDTVGYKKSIKTLTKSDYEAEKVYRIGTTILQQEVKTESVEAAKLGKDSTQTIEDYRGMEVLSSYSKLDLPDLKWVIISEIDKSEVNEPLVKFQRRNLIAMCFIILMMTFLAMYLASRFVRPIDILTKGARNANNGKKGVYINMDLKNEFGELAKSFNNLIGKIDAKKANIESLQNKNQSLLHNFMPETVARRFSAGEKNIADTYPNVSLIVADLKGFSELSKQIGALKSVQLLNDLIAEFDKACKKHQILKIRTIGDTYFAVCGMFTPRLDHSKRMVELSKDLFHLLNRVNQNYKTNFCFHIGIHSGEIMAGIIGGEQFSYDLWGETVNKVFKIKDLGIDNAVIVSDSIHTRLKEIYPFEKVSDKFQNSELGTVWKVKI